MGSRVPVGAALTAIDTRTGIRYTPQRYAASVTGVSSACTSEMTVAESAPIRPTVSRLLSRTSTTPVDHRTSTCPDTGFIP